MSNIRKYIEEVILLEEEVPEEIKSGLIDKLVTAVEMSFLPQGRKEGVTVMTESASLSADKHLQRRKTGGVGNNFDQKPRTL